MFYLLLREEELLKSDDFTYFYHQYSYVILSSIILSPFVRVHARAGIIFVDKDMCILLKKYKKFIYNLI